MNKIYDVIIIGGGVVGASILRKLSKHKISALLLEKEDDISCGASRANSGIVHAGYDCVPNTAMAYFNVEGNKMYEALCSELDVPYRKTGSLVVAPESGLQALKELYNRGRTNRVNVEIIERERILELEPNVADGVTRALYAKDAGVVSPYKLTIALTDSAVINGAEVMLSAEVTAIEHKDGLYRISTPKGEFSSRVLVNAAGANAMKINAMLSDEQYPVNYSLGEYFVLDSTEGNSVSRVVFPLPDENGKGILVAPTADGNVIYGPTSLNTDNTDAIVTLQGLDKIRQSVMRTFKKANYRKVIRVYSGLRAKVGNDFIIKCSELNDGYIMLLGICSPGLTAAPAIAEYVVSKLVARFIELPEKETYFALPEHKKFVTLKKDELAALIAADSRWGRLVCRCEKVSEAEVVNAIHSPVPATTVDAVKRRVRAGMGRCQGGFCAPRVIEILARELNIPITEVKKGGEGSEIAVARIKEDK